MKTVLTLDEDNAARLERLRKQRRATLVEVVNEVIRRGLEIMDAPQPQPFATATHDGGALLQSDKSVEDILRTLDDAYDRKKLAGGP